MMDREKEFARILADTLHLARRQGNRVTRAQVSDAFAPLSFGEAQLAEIHAYLAERKVRLFDEMPKEEEEDTAVKQAAQEEQAASLRDYLKMLQQKRRADKAELERTFEALRTGDEAARARFIEHLLPLVADISRLYEGQGVFTEDLIGEGNVALVAGVSLLEAVSTFEEAEQALSSMIMNAMEDLIRRTLQLRADDQKTLNRVTEVAEKARALSEEYRRNLTVEELLDETGWDKARIEEVLRLTGGGIEGLDTDETQ